MFHANADSILPADSCLLRRQNYNSVTVLMELEEVVVAGIHRGKDVFNLGVANRAEGPVKRLLADVSASCYGVLLKRCVPESGEHVG